MRTFISIEISEEIKKEIGKLIEILRPLASGVKWVQEKNLHITLKFLGEVEEKKLFDVIGTVSGGLKGIRSFKVAFAGTGRFPASESPRVIWIGTKEGAEEQRAIASKLEEALLKIGFKKEEKEFTPHITIGRIKELKGLNRLVRELDKTGNKGFGEMTVDTVTIMKSVLSPKGPKYEAIKKVALEK